MFTLLCDFIRNYQNTVPVNIHLIVLLILVVLIGLVIIFKKQLTNLVNSIFETINSKAGSI